MNIRLINPRGIRILTTLAVIFGTRIQASPQGGSIIQGGTTEDTTLNSMDVVVRNSKTKSVVTCSMIRFAGVDTIVFDATISSINAQRSLHTSIYVAKSDLEKTRLRRLSETRWVLLDRDGRESQYSIDYSMCQPSMKYFVYAGSFSEEHREPVEFSVTTDPVPVVVVVAIVGTIACLTELVIDEITKNCLEEQKQAIQACKEAGGLASIEISSYYLISLSPLKIGCGRICKVVCSSPEKK